MLWRLSLALLSASCFTLTSAHAETPRGLEIHWVDVEGGAATLIVTPAGEGILIDCGYPGPRDAERIAKAAEGAGLKQLDHFAVTHWHIDHYGSLSRLAKTIPIRNYWERGIPAELPEDEKNYPSLIAAYKAASEGKSKTLKPGDEIPLKQKEGAPTVRLLCVCSAGKVLPDKPGAPINPIAKDHKPQAEDKTDNAKSLGFVLSYGDFRFLDLGDLTWNVEYDLVHPTDKLGPIDVYQTTHHGVNISNNPVLISTVKPRVAVFNNGPRKGCHAETTATLRRTPSVQAIYQMHRNIEVGAQENTDPEYIANPDEKCRAENIKLAVAPDGKSYTVTVGSKGKPRKFETRREK